MRLTVFGAICLLLALTGCSSLRLEVARDQPLQSALSTLADEQGYTLDWRLPYGLESNVSAVYEAATLPQLLGQLVGPLGLYAAVHPQNKLIIIRSGDFRD